MADRKPAWPDTPEAAVALMTALAVERSGFSRLAGAQILACWEGRCELTVAMRPELTQHHGFAHGAIVGMVADNACAWAAASVAGDVVTGSYTLNFLAPAKGTLLRGIGTVVRAGKRQVVCRAEVWCESEGEPAILAAIATATIMPVS
jgi:uncharacterized protein (TIGR00369 family)